MVQFAKGAGASPILVSPMIRNTGGALEEQHIWGDLDIRQELIGIAEAESVPLVDLMQITFDWAAEIGRSAAQDYFVTGDATHSNEIGAHLFAEFIVDDLLEQGVSLADHLR